MNDAVSAELLKLNQKLLQAIADSDWETYKGLCDPSITAFEPEALGRVVEGMDFHKFYFELRSPKLANQTTMCSPHVRVMGDVAVLAYVRLNQRVTADGASPYSTAAEETRVWQRQNGQWKHIHFHRTPVGRTN